MAGFWREIAVTGGAPGLVKVAAHQSEKEGMAALELRHIHGNAAADGVAKRGARGRPSSPKRPTARAGRRLSRSAP